MTLYIYRLWVAGVKLMIFATPCTANSKQVQRTSTEPLSSTSAHFSSGLHPTGRTSVESKLLGLRIFILWVR